MTMSKGRWPLGELIYVIYEFIGIHNIKSHLFYVDGTVTWAENNEPIERITQKDNGNFYMRLSETIISVNIINVKAYICLYL